MRAIIIGGGTMGLASAWALAARGVQVDVFERFDHVHERGSHSGHTRIIRQAYHEGPQYVPLVREADGMWVALGETSGETLLVRTGLLECGPSNDQEFLASIAACEHHGVAHEIIDAEEAMRRWPLALPSDWRACFTQSGGYLRVTACFDAMRRAAQSAGARFHYGLAVREISQGGPTPGILLEDGSRHEGDRVIVTAGAWLPALLPELLPGALQRLRRVLLWFAPRDPAPLRDLPVWAAFDPAGFFYGFPMNSDAIGGLKVARHMTPAPSADDAAVDPDMVDRELHHDDTEGVQDFVASRMPAASGQLVAHRLCLYTKTPSSHFVIDRLPSNAKVIVAGGFSGHGFKFAPAVGRLVADLALDESAQPVPDFSIAGHAQSVIG